MPDSRFTMDKLGGLTPEQVIDRVEPDFDGRQDNSDPWTPEREKEGKTGCLKFFYEDRHTWNGIEYDIEFEDNHVVLVTVGERIRGRITGRRVDYGTGPIMLLCHNWTCPIIRARMKEMRWSPESKSARPNCEIGSRCRRVAISTFSNKHCRRAYCQNAIDQTSEIGTEYRTPARAARKYNAANPEMDSWMMNSEHCFLVGSAEDIRDPDLLYSRVIAFVRRPGVSSLMFGRLLDEGKR